METVLEDHNAVVQEPVLYIDLLGSTLSPSKCVALSDSPQLRAAFRQCTFAGTDGPCEVAVDARDLGANLPMAAFHRGGNVA
eukprot:212631-Alexandrium_andersonii.AAC.1